MSMNDMTEAEVKLADEKLRAGSSALPYTSATLRSCESSDLCHQHEKLKHIGINPNVHRLLRLTFNNLSIVPKALWHIQGLRVFAGRRNVTSAVHCTDFFKGSSFDIFHSPSDLPSKRR